MRNKCQQFFWSLVIFIILGAVAGCSKTGSSLTSTPVTYISVINEAPYSSAVDIYLNGTLVSSAGGIAPGQYSTQYASVKPGTYVVDFKVTGTDSLLYEIPSSAFDTANFYTLIFYNTAPGSPNVQATKILDNFTQVTSTNAYYRFFNLSPDVPSADLYFNGSVVQLQRTPADNVNNLGYDNFQSLSPTVYSMQVDASVTDSVLIKPANVAMAAGSVYTLFLSGTYKPGNNQLELNILPATY